MKIASAPRYTPSDGIPPDLDAQLSDLERWAKGAQVDARNDAIKFWLLKAPAILASTCAGLFGQLGWATASLLVAALASACILIDGFRPRGVLRSTHLRALHDIRNLTNSMLSQWRSRANHASPTEVAREIVRSSEPERSRIAKYVRDAEAAFTDGPAKA